MVTPPPGLDPKLRTIAIILAAALFFLSILTIMATVAQAAPEVRDPAASAYSVASSDFIVFDCGFLNPAPAPEPPRVTVTAPNGESLVMFLLPNSSGCSDQPTTSFCGYGFGAGGGGARGYYHLRFDGIASGSDTYGVQHVPSGTSIQGDPGDGTWQIQVQTNQQYFIGNAGAGIPKLCLSVGGKAILVETTFLGGPCGGAVWNQHKTTGTYTDLTCGAVGGLEDDPNEARFYQKVGTNPPIPLTTTNTISCPSSVTVNGVWARGVGQVDNTFVRFVHLQGVVASDTDLRNNLGATLTTLVDDGAGASGDHSAIIGYNNAVGTSYQFLVRAGASGTEQLGSVAFVPAGQCTPLPDLQLSGFVLDQHMLEVTVSQAQCRNDATGFAISHSPSIIGTSSINATIINGFTNTVTIIVDGSQMFILNPTSSPRVLHFNRTLAPGPWVVVVLEDASSETDHFHSHAFNVPSGTCLTPQDKSDLDDHCVPEGINVCAGSGGGGNSSLFGFTALPTFTEAQTSQVLLFLLVLALAAYNGYWFLAFVGIVGTLAPMFTPALLGLRALLMLLMLAVFLEALARGRFVRSLFGKATDKDEEESTEIGK